MRLIFVDDDPQVLEGLRRMLFGRRDLWQMRFFTDPSEALAEIAENPADMVISDLQMPHMDGADLMEQVRRLYPRTIRYILTGVLDHPRLPYAIHCAHQILTKPCHPRLFIEAVERGVTIKSRLDQLHHLPTFSTLGGLPVMPESHQRVLDSISSPETSLRRIGELVAKDVGMSARLVQLANSAYFGRPRRVYDPIQAVLSLGVKTVEAIVLTEGFFARLDPVLIEMFGAASLQSHCLRVGMLARKLCGEFGLSPEQTEAVSTAGILHDAGKIVLITEMPDVFLEILRLSRTEGRPLHEVEHEQIGLSHAELIGAILQLWAMPAEVIEATAFHHRFEDATRAIGQGSAPTAAAVLWLADAIDHHWCSGAADGASPLQDWQRLSYLNIEGIEQKVQHWTQEYIIDQNKGNANVFQTA